MFVIKSRVAAEFITCNGNVGNYDECHKFASRAAALAAMEVWRLEKYYRIRRIIS
jgi:hypothetical protein